MYLQLLWLLEFSSSLLACTLPTMGSVNSTHHEEQREQLAQGAGSAIQWA